MATVEDLIPVLEELSVDNRALLTRIEPFILTSGKPGAGVGAVGSIAIDMTAKVAYGPKAASGADPWGDGDPFLQGPAGASAKAIVIAAGELPSGASDEDFATWLANAQIAAVQPLLDDAETAATAAAADAATAGAAATTATGAATTATTKAGEAAASATAAAAAETASETARDAALAAQAAAEAARDEAEAIAGGDFQPADATLSALAALDSTAGALVQTGADAFAKRAIGASSSTALLDRAAGDGRYVRTVNGVGPDGSGNVTVSAGASGFDAAEALAAFDAA